MEKTLLILALIFATVFFAILLIRITLLIFFHFAKKKYQQFKKRGKKFTYQKKKDFLPKEDEARFVKKELQKPQYERMPSEVEEEESTEIDEVKIVDIVKPVGFFTSMVLGSKLTYLVSSAKLMNKNSNKGFWVSMVEAQARAAGRQRGRSQ